MVSSPENRIKPLFSESSSDPLYSLKVAVLWAFSNIYIIGRVSENTVKSTVCGLFNADCSRVISSGVIESENLVQSVHF